LTDQSGEAALAVAHLRIAEIVFAEPSNAALFRFGNRL
jgi:hypothetical protein